MQSGHVIIRLRNTTRENNVSDVEKCSVCNKNYQVTKYGGGLPGTKEKEDIICPYCGNTITRLSNGCFKTHPLPQDRQ